MKTIYSLLLLCFLVPSLLFSQNSFKTNCGSHINIFDMKLKEGKMLLEQARSIHDFNKQLNLLDQAHQAFLKAKENLEQLGKILAQSEAPKNLSKNERESWKSRQDKGLKDLKESLNRVEFEKNTVKSNQLIQQLKVKKNPKIETLDLFPLSREALQTIEKKYRVDFYAQIFFEPLPWQLDALKKPVFNILKPLAKEPTVAPRGVNYSRNFCNFLLLDQLVQDLKKDPIALAQYVQNEIALDPNSFRKEHNSFSEKPTLRNPLSTFLEEQGSPREQCELLLYLLKQAGYNATVILNSSQLQLPHHFTENLLFTTLPEGDEGYLTFPGVLLKIEDEPITLYPWIKEIQVEEGYDLYNLLPVPLNSAEQWIKGYITQDERITKHIGPNGNDTAGVLFLRFVEEELKKQNLSLEDVGIQRKLCKKQFNNWKDFPQPLLENNPHFTVPFLGDDTIKLTISSAANSSKRVSFNIYASSLGLFPRSLTFSQLENGKHLFTLQLDEDLKDCENYLFDETDHSLCVEIALQGNSPHIFYVPVGTHAALCAHYGRVTQRHLSYFREAFEKEDDENQKLHRLLSFVGMAYFEKCSRAETAFATLHKLPNPTYFAVGLAKLSTDPTGKRIACPQVDMHFSTTHKDTSSPSIQQLIKLLIVDISSNEHQILRDIFQDSNAISTVKLLEIANRKDGGFIEFTKDSFKEADRTPNFPLKDLSGGQWLSLQRAFYNQKDGHLALAYMTPKLISNESIPPSYTGMGTLIFQPTAAAALISSGSYVMNGGYGSRLPDTFLTDLKNRQMLLTTSSSGFTLQKTVEPFFALKEWEKVAYRDQAKFALDSKNSPSSSWKAEFRDHFNTVSDPVDIVSGAFYIDEIDLTLPGAFPLQIRRNYNNQNTLPGLFGYGWKLGLNPYLHEENDKLFAAEMDGTVIVYRRQDDRYIVLAEDNPELRNLGATQNLFHAYFKDGVLYSPDGSKRIFENNLLTHWIDAFGNTLTFNYKNGQLTQIESSSGQYVGFNYTPEGNIREAYTQDGRWVHYHYSYQGDLTEVILPNTANILYTYDAKHQVLKETKPNGRVLENKYDNSGRVIEQLSPVGPQQQVVTSASFKYDDGMTTVTDGEGGTTQYLIHNKQIFKTTDPVGAITYYSWFIDDKSYFDAETRQVLSWKDLGAYPRSFKTIKDKRGLVSEYRYDNSGNTISLTLTGDDLTGKCDQSLTKKFKYNDRHLCIEEASVNRTSKTFYDDFFFYLPKRIEKWVNQQLLSTTTFTYDEKGQLLVQNIDGAITRWVYENSFPIQIIQETGTEDPPVITSYAYNKQGQCIEKITVDGIERNDYDIMGNILSTSLYDLSDKLLSTVYAGYNLNNQMIWRQGPDPRNTLFLDYHAAGYVKASRQSLGDGITAYTLYEHDTRGDLIEEVDPRGVSTVRTLDPIGRPILIAKEGLETAYTYEPGGFVASICSPRGAKTTRIYTTNGLLKQECYPDATESFFVYDFFGRPIQEIKNGITYTTHYDDLNRRVIKTHAGITETEQFDIHGNLIAFIDGEGHTFKKTYDHLGRIKTETSPDNEISTWHYEGNRVTCHLPNEEKTVHHYVAGKLIKSESFNRENILIAKTSFMTDYLNSCQQIFAGDIVTTTWTNTLGQPLKVEEGSTTTLYSYDTCGNCISSADGDGYVTHYVFDLIGRLNKKTLPDGTVIIYDYDADSHLIATHLPNGMTWKASYDFMGRKIEEHLEANQEISLQWKHFYNDGLLQQTIDPLGRTHTYFYDAASRLTKETVDTFTRSFTYDNRNLVLSAEESGNGHSQVLRSYDASGRLTSESISLNSTLIQQTIQAWSPSTRTLTINGHTQTYAYEDGKLKTLSTQGHNLSYDYDLSGNLIRKSSPFVTSDLHYKGTFPETVRSTIKEQPHTESLHWSPSGKLASHNDKAFSYNSRGHLISAGEEIFSFDHGKSGLGIRTTANHTIIPQDGVDAFGKIITELIDQKEVKTLYDAAGQALSKDDASLQWDPWGRLIQVTTPSSTWKAFYDPFGRRIKTTNSLPWSLFPQQTLSYYDPENEFQEIGLKTNSNTFWKVYGPTSCDLLLDNHNNAIGLFTNAIGHVAAIISKENTCWTNLPALYGPLTSPENPTSLLIYAHSLTWHCKPQDPTGFIYLGARHYDPSTGRFLSSDPIGYPIPLNLYSYTNGDPLNFHDFNGRFASRAYNAVSTTVANSFDSFAYSVGSADFSPRQRENFYNAYQNNPSIAPIDNVRFQGGMRVFGGMIEGHIGAGLFMTPTFGAGQFLGSMLMAHGYDNVQSGTRQFLFGTYQEPKTISSLKSLGFSQENAHRAHEFISIAGITGGGIQLGIQQTAQAAISKMPVTFNQPNGNFYSVAFEIRLNTSSYPGISRARHFQEANTSLLKAMEKSSQLSQMMHQLEINIEKTATGLAPRTSPSGWTWHHATEAGTMQLVPRTQHSPGSIFWDSLHPGGKGGYALWGQQHY